MNNEMMQNIRNTAISAATIVEPTGVPESIEMKMPEPAHTTETMAEQIITLLKLLNTRIADRAGKMMSAEISSEPTRFIASTMINAVIIAITRLYTFALTPDALTKFSSNVTANIL